jgi:hypothetical protein
MSQLITPESHPQSPLHWLVEIGSWLLGGAATGLGFQSTEQHSSPPSIGAQPFGGVVSRRRRGLWGGGRPNG